MAATPLLLLPGLMTDARVWDPLIHAASAQRLIVIGQTHTADNIAELAAQAVASMPDGPFAVAGFSLGGYVALELCRQAPEHVAGLALIDTSARADTAEARQNRERMVAALRSGEATFARAIAGFPAKLFHGHHAEDPRLVRLLEGMARSTGQAGFIRQQTAAMHRQDGRDVLKSLRCPALVLCGVDDQVTPPERSQEMADLLAGDVELVTVPSAGHMTTLEQPQAVVQPFLRWLGKVDAARDGESVV
ncbi:alpha/beta hydrolase [Roseateles asaccharophilus]|uniref:Pimeloyl-ACP methyl ester carboxylesterase n=1 Tax=Roseateles asaccharophilus TaxID=582607 RepID=A0ABU2A6U4_9BURK|nr:alpha/beta hydrolase [Roseateles asaccharophilus]MDR7332217.1 pimeloyl-ACP methyl ester carboxylesterase [Roseateles asaccharophilus]